MGENVKEIQGHFTTAVTHERFVAGTHAAVVDDEHRVLIAVLVAKMQGLPLPGGFESAETHDELSGVSVRGAT